MYNSLELIQSKSTFQIQKYGASIMFQSRDFQNSVVTELNACLQDITAVILNYHEQQQLKEQIKMLEQFSWNIAKFTALLPHLPEQIVVFPPKEEMSKQSNDFYFELLKECARKSSQFNYLKQLH
jgi:hypothetical protein